MSHPLDTHGTQNLTKVHRVMDAEELFLSCSNVTLGQYSTTALALGLNGAVGGVITLGVLGTVLLTTKKRAWENLPKRIYLTIILYTLFYCIMTTAAVNYSHPPSQESAWCEAMGFLLHYSGTLVIVHYCAFAFSAVFQVTVPVYLEAVRKKHDNIYSPRKAKILEVVLFVLLFLCPLLDSWEPFLPQLPSYGNYGPSCWFRLELTDNCTTNKSDELFLQTIPFAVLCFGLSVLIFTMSLALCCTYCKFRTKKIGSHIITVIPTILIMTVVSFMMMLWFTVLSAITSSEIGSFSDWLRNATVTRACTIGILVLVGFHLHFPTYLCLRCKRALQQEGGQNEPEIVHPPEVVVANHNAQPVLNPHPSDVDHHKYPTHTTCNIPHSPITVTENTPLISTHPLEVDLCHPTHTTCSISHEPVTTTHGHI